MINPIKYLLYIVMAFLPLYSVSANPIPEKILLEGKWKVVLDSLDQGETSKWFNQMPKGSEMQLPGTLDMAGLGTRNDLEPGINNNVLSHLARKTQYIGKAWYQREFEVSKEWEGKSLVLTLERVMWGSKVWINGDLLGSRESLVGSHQYIIQNQLKPGKNTITIRVDNGNIYPNINVSGNKYSEPTSKDMAHAYTNHTQIKWNGILGEISIGIQPFLDELRIYTDLKTKKLSFTANCEEAISKSKLHYKILQEGVALSEGEVNVAVADGKISGEIQLDEKVKPWDEFNPNLYEFVLSSEVAEVKNTFGARQIGRNQGDLELNGNRIFLRGTLECAVFPETGFPFTDKSSWLKVIRVAQDYGLNHFRFHSWCPPKAAFEAADELGFYLQAELPHWSLKVGEDKEATRFLENEAQKILEDYGNHPSFILMSMGNELQGDIQWLNDETAKLKAQDSRRLYTTTTFSFQKGVGRLPQPEDEFFVTQWTDRGWVRGQGIFNDKSPHFDKDYQSEVEHIEVPVISHEIGQYSVFPDISEIEKYTGVLRPLNFVAIKDDLEKKGLLRLADEFTYASGKLASILYKEEIERALKTPGFDGFQLLQLQDFPGQGTALVGLLNVFWESKGIIESEEFSEFCSEVVPLIRFEKAVYQSGEVFEAEVEVANFYKTLEGQSIKWSIEDDTGSVISGAFKDQLIPLGNEAVIGKISQKLDVEKALRLTVKLEIEETSFKNEWSIWVYPEHPELEEKVYYTRSLDQAKVWLTEGKSVLLNPEVEKLNGVTGRFVPVFWSPVHFPDQPSTMGILCDPKHPAFNAFPTEGYSNWQWWDLTIQSKSLIIDGMEVDPIVRVIDNFVTNRNLANVFEAKFGKGKLMFSSIDLGKDLDSRIAAKQLRISLEEYMNSTLFNPKSDISEDNLRRLIAD